MTTLNVPQSAEVSIAALLSNSQAARNDAIAGIVQHGVAGERGALQSGIEMARLFMVAVRDKVLGAADARTIRHLVDLGVATARNLPADSVKDPSASRVSEIAKAAALAKYACADHVFATMATIGIGLDGFYAVGVWITKADNGIKVDQKEGPSREKMLEIVRARHFQKMGKNPDGSDKAADGEATDGTPKTVNIAKTLESIVAKLATLREAVAQKDGHELLDAAAKSLDAFKPFAERAKEPAKEPAAAPVVPQTAEVSKPKAKRSRKK